MVRPCKPVNDEELLKLVSMGCTYPEIAGWFGVSERTVERWAASEERKGIFESGRANMKISLRRAQLEAATNGNAAMLIWLGKTQLGQKDTTYSVTTELPATPLKDEMRALRDELHGEV